MIRVEEEDTYIHVVSIHMCLGFRFRGGREGWWEGGREGVREE